MDKFANLMKCLKHDVTQRKGTVIHSFHSGKKSLLEQLMLLKGSIEKENEKDDESEDSDETKRKKKRKKKKKKKKLEK